MCTHVVVVCQMHICERNLSCDSPARRLRLSFRYFQSRPYYSNYVKVKCI